MKNYSKIIIGVLLIAAGILFLGKNYGWFSFDVSFSTLAKWWPALLIVAGIGVFLNPQRKLGNPLTVLAIAFAIPMALFSVTRDGIDRVSDNRSFNFDREYSDEDDNDNSTDEGEDYSAENDGGNRTNEQVYTVDNESGIKNAKLDFGGGAAEFHLEPTTDHLFYAKTSLSSGGYKLESETKSGGEKEIVFEMKNQKNNNFRFDTDNNFNNSIYLKMNPKVTWDVKMGIGAGDLDFDFSEFRIENLKVETGAASVKLKLSDLEDRVDVKIESGVAKVDLAVPSSVGCRIEMDGAMNSKDFNGFQKVDDDTWETKGYSSSNKKITIKLDSGLSSIKVSRY